jgi:hypothetical protein
VQLRSQDCSGTLPTQQLRTLLLILSRPVAYHQAATNIPGARYLASAVLHLGKMWLIGGLGYVAAGSGMTIASLDMHSHFTVLQLAISTTFGPLTRALAFGHGERADEATHALASPRALLN